MEEPSVLDYVKSRLTFWKPSSLRLPGDGLPGDALPDETSPNAALVRAGAYPAAVSEGIQAREENTTAGGEPTGLTTEAPSRVEVYDFPPALEDMDEAPSPVAANAPWFALLAAFTALLGQRAFEPAVRAASTGLALYALAIAFALMAYWRGEWRLRDLPESQPAPAASRVRGQVLFASVPLLLLAAVTFFGFNHQQAQFNFFNLAFWLSGTGLLSYAFWVKHPYTEPVTKTVRRFFASQGWRVSINRWVLMVVLVAVIVLFFRVFRMSAVPSQMVSDHAEKLMDVQDVLDGSFYTYFPRNTGREFIQFYLTAAIALLFKTGISFTSLKIGTIGAGLLTLPFLYRLGKEIGNRRVGLFAVFFAGIAYWPNVISRFGLRFPFYPLFVAPVLFYIIRGLRTSNRNDFIKAGLALGLGLHGYTPIRILPFVVAAAFLLYLLHRQSAGKRMHAVHWFGLVGIIALALFIPLAMYWIEDPYTFVYRSFSRVGTMEQALPGPAWNIFWSNVWNALRAYNWDDGEIWVISITHRPALDVVSGALFLLGAALVAARYIRRRHWLDLFLLLAVPLLMLPSILSLAFPNENPALNRGSASLVPVFLLVAVAADGLYMGLRTHFGRSGPWAARTAVVFLALVSMAQNYGLVFNQYAAEFNQSMVPNTTEMGEAMRSFSDAIGTDENAFIVPWANWADTRLVAVEAGLSPYRSVSVERSQLAETVFRPGPKLFIVNLEDNQTVDALESLYPQGSLSRYASRYTSTAANKDFLLYFVPPAQGANP